MALQVARVAPPAAGADWQTLVPGQYLYDVTGITATLTTGAGPVTVAHDSTVHGLDGTYHTFIQPLTFVPGLVTGDLALFTGPNGNAAVAGVDVPAGVLDWHNPFTLALWVAETATPNNPYFVYHSLDNAGNGVVIVIWDQFAGNIIEVSDGIGAVWQSPPNALPNDGSTHFLTLVWDGANLTLYMNNVVIPWAVVPGPPSLARFAFTGALAMDDLGNVAGNGVMDELALFNYGIVAGDVNSMFAAASVSFAAYTAAVLALGPVAYYHLDDQATGGGRTVALSVTDGTNEVALLGSGFPAIPTAGTSAYSWTPTATSSSQAANGSTITVAIPRLVLPAGYTIGTFTPDIGPGDQWSDIAVWWSDDIQVGLDPAKRPKYPPGAFLSYKQQGT